MKTKVVYYFLAALVIIMVFFSLKSYESNCDRLEKNIDKALKDSVLTDSEFEKIVTFVESKRKSLIKCHPEIENTVDLEATVLNDIIQKQSKNFASVKCEPCRKENTDISANLFLETSLSMDGYDNKLLHEFKETIGALLGNFDNSSRRIFVVNNNVYETNLNYQRLINDDNIFNSTMGYGRRDFTDFGKIFKAICDKTEDNQVSVLISDLIISQDSSKKTNAGIISESELKMRDLFRDYSDEYSVIILKFNAHFSGTYYAYNNMRIKYDGKRPFYATLIARNKTMNTLLMNPEFSNFSNWNGYQRFDGLQYFTKIKTPEVPKYTIDMTVDKTGKYRKDKDEMLKKNDYVHSLEDVGVSTSTKALEIPVNASFDKFYLADSLILNTNNYSVYVNNVESTDFKVSAASKLLSVPGFTHRLTIKYLKDNFHYDDVRIEVKMKNSNAISSWVESSNLIDDTSQGTDFARKTFGIKALVGGIGQAYVNPNKTLYTFSLNLKK